MNAHLRRLDPGEWAVVVREFLDYGHRQGPEYCRLLALRSGSAAEAVVCEAEGRVVGAANVRVRRVPMVGGGIAYLSGGPLVRRGDREAGAAAAALCATLGALRDEYVVRRGLVLRVAPALGDEPWNREQAGIFAESGFALGRGPLYRTIVVDLGPDEARLRAGLHQKWRNGLNNAERQGLTVRTGTGTAEMERFADLYRGFRDRKGFHAELDADFYAAVQRGAGDGERLVVQLAEKDGNLVAGHVSVMAGDTCTYLLGATSEAGLRCKAAYLLQWRTMRTARERGLRWYDLGGIDPNGNPGVHHFKEGMGGAERSGPGPFELRPGNVRSLVALSSESLYRRLKRARVKS